MIPVSPGLQYATDMRFVHTIKQTFGPKRTPIFTPELQKMLMTSAATVHSFNGFQQLVSPRVSMQYRNELARAFISSLKNNDWNEDDSNGAISTVNWLLSMKKGQVGGYLKIIRPMIDLACTKLTVPLAQKQAWKKVVAEKPRICPKDLGKQSVNALPRPNLRGLFSR